MPIVACVPSPELAEAVAGVDGVDVVTWDGAGDPPADVRDTEFLVAGYMGAPLDLVSALPRLRVVQLLSAGVERWVEQVPDGVTLCNGRGIHGVATAELAVTGILALTRRLPFFLTEQAARRWTARSSGDLDGKRVLVLGAGEIGRKAAAALEVFGAVPTFVARTARDGVHAIGELADLAPAADIVVVALPLTDETDGLLDAAFLAALPDGAIVANVARGRILDTDALLAELRTERISAFLDVTEPEPLPADHPLWDAPNLVLTPHVAGGTTGWEKRAHRLVRRQLEQLVAGGQLANVVGEKY